MREKKKLKSVIVILNWNRLDLMKQLLLKLKNQTTKDFGIIVVDNGSNDGSKEYLTALARQSAQEDIPIWTILLLENKGFAPANNLAMTFALDFLEFRYYLLLNNDTVPEDNFVETMIKKAESYTSGSDQNVLELEKRLFPFLSRKSDWKIGSFSPLVENYFARGIVDAAGIKISPDGNAINRGVGEKIYKFNREKEVFGPSGSAVLYLKKALLDVALPPRMTAVLLGEKFQDVKKEKVWFAKLGVKNNKIRGTIMPVREFFSSRYFAYFEDVDLAWRLRLRYWGCVYLPEARILHHHSATAKAYSPFKSFFVHRNQYFNILRIFPSYLVVRGFYNAFKRYFYLLKSLRSRKGPAAMVARNSSKATVFWLVLKGWGSILFNLYGLLKERLHIQTNRLIAVAEFKKLAACERFRADMAKMIFETHDFLTEQKKTDGADKDRISRAD